MTLEQELKEAKSKFEQYKKEYPFKVGNIGGKQVSVNTVNMLQQQADTSRAETEKVNQQLEQLQKEFKQYKKEHA